MNFSSYTLLAATANYQASACSVSLQPTFTLQGQAASKLCVGMWGLLYISLRAAQRRKEGNSTNTEKNITEDTEGRKTTKVTVWQVHGLAFPVREACFSKWNLDHQWPIRAIYWYSLFFQAYSNAAGNDICVDNYLLSPSWAISSSSTSVFAAAIAWGNFRVNGRTSLLWKRKITIIFKTISKVLNAFVFNTCYG